MDYSQPAQQDNSPEFFSGISVGQGSSDPNLNNFEAENNLNTNNWDVSPDRNPGNVGNVAMSSASQSQNLANQAPDFLPLPSAETPTMPSEVYHPTAESFNPTLPPNYSQAPEQVYGQTPNQSLNQTPELGQITPLDQTQPTTETADTIADASDFTWSKIMSGDKLTDKTIDNLRGKIRELNGTGDIAAFDDFLAAARENMQRKVV